MFSYAAYGLGIRSGFPLPNLLPMDCDTDVTVQITGPAPVQASSNGWEVRFSSDEATLAHSRIGCLTVRGGHEILATPAPGVDNGLIGLVTETTAMAAILYQRGYLTLHASAVEVAGIAILFTAPPGVGKSSVAAAACARGHRLIADDIVAIDSRSGQILAIPAFPALKLFPNIADLLGYGVQRPLHAVEQKVACWIPERFACHPVRVGRVYALEEEEDAKHDVESLVGRASIIELLSNVFLSSRLNGAAHLLRCAEIAETVPVYRLSRSPRLDQLPRLAQFVEGHVRSSHGSATVQP